MKEKTTTTNRQFCTFRIDDRLYGIDILDVKEIKTIPDTVPVHHSPSKILGIVNLRGRIYLLLNLCLMLGRERKAPGSEEERIVVLKSSVGEHFAVLVDTIEDVVSVGEESIECCNTGEADATSRGASIHTSLCDEVCTLETELLVLIKADRLLSMVDRTLSGT